MARRINWKARGQDVLAFVLLLVVCNVIWLFLLTVYWAASGHAWAQIVLALLFVLLACWSCYGWLTQSHDGDRLP